MNRIVTSLIVTCAPFLIGLPAASAISIDWTPVGNPGNAPDPATGSLYGGVGYAYNIDKYDVTNSQYVAFLNSNDPTGLSPLQLYNSNMSDSLYGGINYNSGSASGSKYSAISGRGNNPVNSVTFYDALRFANWLDNGQAAGSTETGAYTLYGGTPTPSNGNSITRNAGATIFLPSENEWYKAAFYNPATSSYYLYPTSSNKAPTASGPTSTPNSANYNDVLLHVGFPAVGAYTGTTSPYGAFDMAGDVWQWNESIYYDGISHYDRGFRGGSLYYDSTTLNSSALGFNNPTDEHFDIGFRVASAASVPEPSSITLAAFGAFAQLGYVRRRRQRRC